MFDGFPLGMLHFLEELSRNNRKKWFDANKDRYESEVRGPALDFISAMAGPSGKKGPLHKVSPHFKAEAKKVGGSLMRIHRDVRFSKDKAPYKTNVGIHFRHEAGKDVHAPGLYLHIDTERVFIGVGTWHPATDALSAIRQAIADDPKRWSRAKGGKAFRERFELAGDSLKRPPRGFDPEHPMIEDLKRKDHIAICPLDHDQLFDKAIVKTTTDAFRAAKSYAAFLCEAIGVDF